MHNDGQPSTESALHVLGLHVTVSGAQLPVATNSSDFLHNKKVFASFIIKSMIFISYIIFESE